MFRFPLFACTMALSLACSADRTALVAAPARASFTQSTMLAPARCSPPTVHEGRALVPDKVTWMLETDLGALMKSPLGGEIRAALGSTPEFADAVAGLAKCGLDLGAVDRVTMAGAASDDVMGVISVPGIGTDATLDCLHDAASASTGPSPWTKTTKACTTSLELSGGTTVAYVADRDTLVFVSARLDAAVRDRLAGRGTPALSGAMAWVAADVDLKRALWFAMEVPSSLGTAFPVAGLQRVGGSIDPSKGIGLDVVAGFSTTQQAQAAHAQLSMIPAMGPMLGLPSSLTDGISVDRKGASVELEAFVSTADLAELKRIAGIDTGAKPKKPPAGI